MLRLRNIRGILCFQLRAIPGNGEAHAPNAAISLLLFARLSALRLARRL